VLCLIKTAGGIPPAFGVSMGSVTNKVYRFDWWRWLSIVFAGLSVRFTIDLILRLKYSDYGIRWDTWEYTKAVLLALVLLESIRWINRRLDEKYTWESRPFLRFFAQFITNVLFVLAIITGALQISFHVFGSDGFFLANSTIISLTAIAYTLLVILMEVGIYFLKKWRISLAELEKFKKENIQFQFEMLRAQVNPHFLFNSLNTLAGLIHSQPENASQFVRQLSKVYRNVIRSREREVIQLGDELDNLQAYLDLMKLRFGPNMKPVINIESQYHDWWIAPMILQMLIENAVKHNVATDKKPLNIVVSIDPENDYIIVENDLQRKSTPRTPSGAGLRNIISRYAYIIDKEVIVDTDAKTFTVKVPILRKEYESPDY
jgi:hypothetical protein